ncbi:hypothetical protein POM88_030896 [Heracleum sosnowskyi]|uniref:Ubiquitin-like protease family profile domain-containing protein n=1 Tax=Heracleum sosnowskyi TaxID=360622 RepID=A0AAD8MJS9_9APIA|nr:hypothetical protein POM88_030896 [Heracleum sosnowskyi]
MTPNNLRSEIEGIPYTAIKGTYDVSSYSGKGKIVLKDESDDMEAHHMVGDNADKFAGILRPRRGIKASHFCRSPYVSRVVDENKMIESTVIDTWSYLLNENEILRDNCSPLRIFMTSETIYGPLTMEVGKGATHNKLERKDMFHDNLDIVVQMVCDMHNKKYEVKDFDMFVFPIYFLEHHFVICYNMKKPTLDILDNKLQTEGVDDNYGDLPARLHECFCDWLSICNVPKESEINNLVPRVVRVGWQTVESFVDYGVFAMRHMETYMGNLYKWKVGLRSERDNQKMLLNKLRIIYCHRILTWTGNCKRARIVSSAAKFAKGKNLV